MSFFLAYGLLTTRARYTVFLVSRCQSLQPQPSIGLRFQIL